MKASQDESSVAKEFKQVAMQRILYTNGGLYQKIRYRMLRWDEEVNKIRFSPNCRVNKANLGLLSRFTRLWLALAKTV